MSVLTKVTLKVLRKNKVRTISTIFGVALSSALLFGVGIIMSTVQEKKYEKALQAEGNSHFVVQNVEKKDIPFKEIEEFLYEEKYVIEDSIEVGYVDMPYHKLFTLKEGIYPQKEGEIVLSELYAKKHSIHIGDSLLIKGTKYQVVGIWNTLRIPYLKESLQEKTSYTVKGDKSLQKKAYFYLKSTKNAYEQIKEMALSLGKKDNTGYNSPYAYEDVLIHEEVLSLSFEFSNYGVFAVLFLGTLFISTVLGILCVFIISNSFSISVVERKKVLGMLSGLGATPNDLLKSVLIEALFIGIIAIPLGLLFSILFVFLTILILNHILEGVEAPIHMSISFFFIALSFLFNVIVLFFSAFFPAKRASEAMPIENIRMQDIHGKHKKQVPLLGKIFGIEGDLASKSQKRNKKKYRATTISLTISIVLFMTVQIFTSYILEGTRLNREEDASETHFVSLQNKREAESFIKEVKRVEGLTHPLVVYGTYLWLRPLEESAYTDAYLKEKSYTKEYRGSVMVHALPTQDYKAYLKKLGLNENTPIFYNQMMTSGRKEIPIYKEGIQMEFCHYESSKMDASIEGCYQKIDSIYLTDIPFTDRKISQTSLLLDINTYQSLLKEAENYKDSVGKDTITIYFDQKNPKKVDSSIQSLIRKYPTLEINYYNVEAEEANLITTLNAIRFGVYAFIFFITLIGITSIFNTIHTNMELRKREFMTLQSVGQSDQSFHKMILLESFLIGFKSLLYGSILSYVIYYSIKKITSLSYGSQRIQLLFPYHSFILCLLFVLLLIFIIMLYSARKIEKNNIVETIREENI